MGDKIQTDVCSREKKALLSALSEMDLNAGMIINDSEKRVEKSGNRTLNIVPIWEWLLNQKVGY